MEESRKVLVIGLDGVTFDLVRPWAEAGKLPNMAALLRDGAWGVLQSTIPAHSGPAWATFATGLQPGNHGVYQFAGASRDEEYFRPVSSDSIRSRFFWDVAGDQGATVGVINVPLTYPPRPTNGYVVAGLFTPDGRSAFDSPALYEEVVAHCGEYVPSAPVLQNRRAFLDALLAGMRNRLDTGEYLLEHHPTDLFIIVFRMIDSVMHRYWTDMDPQHPLHAGLGRNVIPDAILEGYQLLDESIGRLRAKAGPEYTLYVVSDHGFRAEDRTFAFNKWLRDRGMLALKRQRSAMIGMAKDWAERLHLEMLLKRAGKLYLKAAGVEGRYESWLYRSVDWSRTKVVFGPTMGMNINLKGRDALGVVEPDDYEALRDWLIEELQDIVDPATSLPIFHRVCRREEVYAGRQFDLAPDVVIEMAEYWTDGRHWGYGIAPLFSESQLFLPPTRRLAGEHSPGGVFMAAGPSILPGCYDGLNIVDVAPTILYSLGLQTPLAMEGRVLTELFAPDHLADWPVQKADIDLYEDHSAGQDTSAEYEDVVTGRLRELGYID